MSYTNSTPNYGLPEFLSSDKPAWMADINTAFSTIDTTMKANEDSASQANTDIGTMGLNLAPGYSNASTYDVGDIVMYNKRVYICDVAVNVPEAFDSAKWSYYRLSDVGETANTSADLLGNTDISSVGDGTVTGAVSSLNANLSNKANFKTVTTDASSNPFSAFRVLFQYGQINQTGVYVMNTSAASYFVNVFYISSSYVCATMFGYTDNKIMKTTCQNGTWTDSEVTLTVL